jgi:hypothetical protein
VSASDPLDLIEEGCYLAHRMGLKVSAGPANCMVVREGIYCFSREAREYSPLEAVLVGVEVRNSDWRNDASNKGGW